MHLQQRSEEYDAFFEHVRDSLKVNMSYAASLTNVYGPLFFRENSVIEIIYLDMFSKWLPPPLQEGSANFIVI
jgi:hypothetical protein